MIQQDVAVPACSSAHARPDCLVPSHLLNLCRGLDAQLHAEIRVASSDLMDHPVYHNEGRAVMMGVQSALLSAVLSAVLSAAAVVAVKQSEIALEMLIYVEVQEVSAPLGGLPETLH